MGGGGEAILKRERSLQKMAERAGRPVPEVEVDLHALLNDEKRSKMVLLGSLDANRKWRSETGKTQDASKTVFMK